MCAPRLANDTVMLTATVMVTIVSNMFNFLCVKMSLLYHNILICQQYSDNYLKVYCKTSAPSKPIKQAPINNKKNVILFSFHSIIYYRQCQCHFFNNSTKKLIFLLSPYYQSTYVKKAPLFYVGQGFIFTRTCIRFVKKSLGGADEINSLAYGCLT